MKTFIPAVLHLWIASLTEGLGGSINDKNPTKVNPSIGKFGTSLSESNLKPFGYLSFGSSKCANPIKY